MKQIRLVLVVTIIVGFISCKDKKQPGGKDAANQKAEVVIQDFAKDSAEIRTVITDFYNWYNKSYAKLQEYKLYSSIKKKDAPPYKINWGVVERYQQFIRDSVPQLGEEFIKNQKHFFQQCDSAFKVDVNDDIPYGFDYDWYTNSQEDPQYRLDQINGNYRLNQINGNYSWIIKIEGDRANVQIGGSRPEIDTFVLYLKKENRKWTIAQIADNDW